eukprot:m.38330 g.38330  ORF g.38330 m.38330 type:complete len:213 (-) comp9967_c0_seq1:48-686(-)
MIVCGVVALVGAAWTLVVLPAYDPVNHEREMQRKRGRYHNEIARIMGHTPQGASAADGAEGEGPTNVPGTPGMELGAVAQDGSAWVGTGAATGVSAAHSSDRLQLQARAAGESERHEHGDENPRGNQEASGEGVSQSASSGSSDEGEISWDTTSEEDNNDTHNAPPASTFATTVPAYPSAPPNVLVPSPGAARRDEDDGYIELDDAAPAPTS